MRVRKEGYCWCSQNETFSIFLILFLKHSDSVPVGETCSQACSSPAVTHWVCTRLGSCHFERTSSFEQVILPWLFTVPANCTWSPAHTLQGLLLALLILEHSKYFPLITCFLLFQLLPSKFKLRGFLPRPITDSQTAGFYFSPDPACLSSSFFSSFDL